MHRVSMNNIRKSLPYAFNNFTVALHDSIATYLALSNFCTKSHLSCFHMIAHTIAFILLCFPCLIFKISIYGTYSSIAYKIIL